MITPNKTIPFKDSIVFKMTYILDIEFDEISLIDLYKLTKKKFLGIEEFIYSLDALYVLGKIDMDTDIGKIKKC
jgi:hypothetical protein